VIYIYKVKDIIFTLYTLLQAVLHVDVTFKRY